MALSPPDQSEISDIISKMAFDDYLLSDIAEFMSEELVEALDTKVQDLAKKVAELEDKVDKQRSEIKNIEAEIQRLEQEPKSRSLKFIGISGEGNEDLKKSVEKLLTDTLKLSSSEFEIELCYRISIENDETIVTFTTYAGCETVCRNVSKLNGTHVVISSDFTEEDCDPSKACKSRLRFTNVWPGEQDETNIRSSEDFLRERNLWVDKTPSIISPYYTPN